MKMANTHVSTFQSIIGFPSLYRYCDN